MQRWKMVLCLQKAETLAATGNFHQACSVCQETVGFSSAAGCDIQLHANTAQVHMLAQLPTP